VRSFSYSIALKQFPREQKLPRSMSFLYASDDGKAAGENGCQ